MKTMIIKGKEIKTNYNQEGNYTINNEGSYRYSTYYLNYGKETELEMLERLVEMGYTTITFKRSSTSVRGYYKTYAVVRK